MTRSVGRKLSFAQTTRNLKIKTLLAKSRNGILTEIQAMWCTYLALVYISVGKQVWFRAVISFRFASAPFMFEGCYLGTQMPGAIRLGLEFCLFQENPKPVKFHAAACQ